MNVKKQLLVSCFILSTGTCIKTMELTMIGGNQENRTSTYISLVQKKLDANDPQKIALENAVLRCSPNQVLKLLKEIPSANLYLILAEQEGIMQKAKDLAKSPTWAIKRRVARALWGLGTMCTAYVGAFYYGEKFKNLHTDIANIRFRNNEWNNSNCFSELPRCTPLELCTLPRSTSWARDFAMSITTNFFLVTNSSYQLYHAIRNFDGHADQKKYAVIHLALQAKFNELAVNYVI
jgi:hypothetical protein